MSGKIAGGQKQKINIKICPTMPKAFEEEFEIQMGYYEPDRIVVRGEGVYPSLICHFPRLDNTELDAKLKEQVEKYSKLRTRKWKNGSEKKSKRCQIEKHF